MDYNHVENLVTRFIEEDDLEAKEELIKSFMPFIKKFSKQFLFMAMINMILKMNVIEPY